ncbi:polysaccharide deacetylase family protein [Croceicoccus sp. BE223]|uniref:polysaccharide deacetylase family protein n=1 Tax=Croceicoccus sp. BE223 TaxID=2817716 RepID=UPI00285F6D30|nr:polysaccharide deacetylase family protein [Croceicoccus sp. BE223]MDR7101849.1 peptidoglycan/xylan/chitin deacetylase (PgdA/CDA1 family) [Croceicoccus sp. BE223]
MNTERLKSILLRVGLLIGILACILTAFVNLAQLRCFNAFVNAACNVSTTRNLVALTFDDGPSAAAQGTILPLLAANGAKATFFLSGQKLEKDPAAARAVVAAGHEIGNLGYSNQVLENRPQSFYAEEIERTDALLRKAGVEKPYLFRPPYGMRSVGLLWELHQRDYKLIMWDVSDNGRREAPAQAYASAILAQVQPGSIVMLHAMGADDEDAREALPLILQGLKERGLKSVTVSELLATDGR